MKKKFTKSIKEQVIRKALYWIPPDFEWELTESEDYWVVEILSNSSEFDVSRFERTVNDFILREKIDSETGNLRRAIIVKALKDIEEGMNNG